MERIMKPFQSVFIIACVLLSTMCASQSPVYSQQQKSLTDKEYKKSILQTVDSLIEHKYVIADKAKKFADEFRKRSTAGGYEPLADPKTFAERVTADLQSITQDKHSTFRTIESSDVGEKAESNLHHPVRYYRLRMKEHTGFTKLEWIDGRIGYLELRRFNMLGEAREMLGIAMKFLRGADAIIIDLRENEGGSGDYLSSYFLPHPTQLTGAYYREGNDLQESWTSRNIEGERMLDVPLFLVTSRKTFSAAESFAYDMKVRKRATLVGDSTKGGAHDVGYFKIDNQFEMYLSIGRGINPVTQTNWEGVGVVPDVVVPASSALDTAIVLARKAAEEYGRKNDDQLKQGVERMEIHLARAEHLYRDNNTVSAKACLDSMFQIAGTLGLVTEFFINVLAYNYYSDRSENILLAVLNKSIELFPTSSAAFEVLASAYYDLGKKGLAREYYRKVLELDPDITQARKRLKELAEKE
jgi:tetratricopeptide (TPR) repeat protein